MKVQIKPWSLWHRLCAVCWLLYLSSLVSSDLYLSYLFMLIQNSLASTVFSTPKTCHITPPLACLHWLKIKERIEYKLLSLTYNIFTARCYASADYAVMQSVRPSVTFVDHIKTNKHIFEIFPPSGSDTILVFPYQRGCWHSDGNPPNGGVECKRGMIKWRFFSQISRSISETVIDRWAHAARQLVSIEFSFHPYSI